MLPNIVLTGFIPGMTLWLDANDVNGDGLSESASDFTFDGGKTQVGMGGPFGVITHHLGTKLTSL